MSSQFEPAFLPNYARILACALCQYRKVKCDRRLPCGNCVKANAVCTPGIPAPPRPRRRPNQDLKERLAKCEELLSQYSEASKVSTNSSTSAAPFAGQHPSSSNTISDGGNRTPTWSPACDISKEDGHTLFMDGYFWANLSKEVRAMRDIMEAPELRDDDLLEFDKDGPATCRDLLTQTPSSETFLQPNAAQSLYLWTIFLDRINPLTKVIHVPTIQPYALRAAAEMSSFPSHVQALLFSIYNLALLSLTDDECINMLNISREAASKQFTTDLKMALTRFNFLKNYHMFALQALVLYLHSLAERYDPHAIWVLGGTVVRIAQKMGYHRDGELLNLEPFEVEMRRRIWWQIVTQDSAYAMSSGLSQSVLPRCWDTRPPQNLDDADIVPGSLKPVQPRQGATEMAFCIILHECFTIQMSMGDPDVASAFEAALMGQDIHGHGTASSSQQPIFEMLQVKLRRLEENLIDLETKYVFRDAGPVHTAALAIRPLMVDTMKQMLVPMHQQPEWGTEILNASDNHFKTAIIGMEHKIDTMKRFGECGFHWFAKRNFQFDLFLALTSQLGQRTTGGLATRAWDIVKQIYVYRPEFFDMSQSQYFLLAQSVLAAWIALEKSYSYQGLLVPVPQFIERLQALVAFHETRLSAPLTTITMDGQSQSQSQVQEHQPSFNSREQTYSDLSENLILPILDVDLLGYGLGNI